ncbi:uncharacterized protein LOC111714548 [Eurytemora carolleeae]|uniref:uncharacterized protein LOC111714548 n=1 Tax=Eurytemora carolleeae TaxID=1294199 RepID=UPI000C77A524|nr:uncharacterized protein LOC111714548 [Eurytemora carolleeae]|eukprot:XP_023345447.1 uncharacterized protein LOC111714548 [Eurytemora affinis]
MKRSQSLPSPNYRQEKNRRVIPHKVDPLEEELIRAVLMYKTDKSTVHRRAEMLMNYNQIVSRGILKEINQLVSLLQRLGCIWLDLDIQEILNRLVNSAQQIQKFSVSLESRCFYLGEIRQEERTVHLVDIITRYLESINTLGSEMRKEKDVAQSLVKSNNIKFESDPNYSQRKQRLSLCEDSQNKSENAAKPELRQSDIESRTGSTRLSVDYSAKLKDGSDTDRSVNHSFSRQSDRLDRLSLDHGRRSIQLRRIEDYSTSRSDPERSTAIRQRRSLFENNRERYCLEFLPEEPMIEDFDIQRKASKKVSIAENLNCDYSDESNEHSETDCKEEEMVFELGNHKSIESYIKQIVFIILSIFIYYFFSNIFKF